VNEGRKYKKVVLSAVRITLYGILGCDAMQNGRRIPITTLEVEAEGTLKTLVPICHTGRRRTVGLPPRRYA
jgi:hypothetical protein